MFDVDHGEEQIGGQRGGVELHALDAGHSVGEEVAVEVLKDSSVAPGDAAELGDDAGTQEVGGVSPARRRAGDESELHDGRVSGSVAGGGLSLFIGEDGESEA